MELGEKWPSTLPADFNFHVNRRVLLQAANLRRGTDGFTSPPKEGILWIFSPEKSDGFDRVRTRWHVVYCVLVISVGCTTVKETSSTLPVVQPSDITRTQHTKCRLFGAF
jgi:hypothetical protein